MHLFYTMTGEAFNSFSPAIKKVGILRINKGTQLNSCVKTKEILEKRREIVYFYMGS